MDICAAPIIRVESADRDAADSTCTWTMALSIPGSNIGSEFDGLLELLESTIITKIPENQSRVTANGSRLVLVYAWAL